MTNHQNAPCHWLPEDNKLPNHPENYLTESKFKILAKIDHKFAFRIKTQVKRTISGLRRRAGRDSSVQSPRRQWWRGTRYGSPPLQTSPLRWWRRRPARQDCLGCLPGISWPSVRLLSCPGWRLSNNNMTISWSVILLKIAPQQKQHGGQLVCDLASTGSWATARLSASL